MGRKANSWTKEPGSNPPSALVSLGDLEKSKVDVATGVYQEGEWFGCMVPKIFLDKGIRAYVHRLWGLGNMFTDSESR
jgi:hypothetical protein